MLWRNGTRQVSWEKKTTWKCALCHNTLWQILSVNRPAGRQTTPDDTIKTTARNSSVWQQGDNKDKGTFKWKGTRALSFFFTITQGLAKSLSQNNNKNDCINGYSAEALMSWKNFSGRGKEKARRRSRWFSRTADKERNNYRGSKNLFSAFFWEPFLLYLPLSLSPWVTALCWPNPNLILHFTSIPDDFTVVIEHWISSFFPQMLSRGHAKMAPR